jgi:hypothetical protein
MGGLTRHNNSMANQPATKLLMKKLTNEKVTRGTIILVNPSDGVLGAIFYDFSRTEDLIDHRKKKDLFEYLRSIQKALDSKVVSLSTEGIKIIFNISRD